MAFSAYIHDNAGTELVPLSKEDWSQWVSASRTRNWCNGAMLNDWMELYGEANGFQRDPEPDRRADWTAFVFAMGNAFESAVVEHLESLLPVYRLSGGWERSQSFESCQETYDAMCRGEEVIHQAVLRNPANNTYGSADLLVRSDVLRRLFPDALGEAESMVGAPGIGSSRWHYRVIDIKYTGLKLNKDWEAGNEHLAYKVQVFVYNEALGRIQGFTPPHGYLLGRGWTKGTHEEGSTSCMDRLAPVAHEGEVTKGLLLRDAASQAVTWLRTVRSEGACWNPRIRGSRAELRPNVKAETEPWSTATKALAAELEDLSLLWQARADKVAQLSVQGIDRSSHPDFRAADVTTAGNALTLEKMLAVTSDPGSTPVRPAFVRAEREVWGQPAPVEFYVDFETVSNIKDDFTRIPEQNGNPRIFMIGCGHPEDGEFKMRIFTAADMSDESEVCIIEEWLEHMTQVRRRLDRDGQPPLVYHWSPAETSTLTSAINAARGRHQDREASWTEPRWFDFLKLVVKAEPVVVSGAGGFGLKAFAKAMRNVVPHRISPWPDGVVDGLGAMVAGWWCEDEARKLGCSMKEIHLMKEIEAYNEIDCRVMWEIVSYLREKH